jgi:zinc protease
MRSVRRCRRRSSFSARSCEPAFPAAEFDTTKRRSLAGSEAILTDPSALASNRLQRALSPYSPNDVRYVPTPEESRKRLEAVTLDDVIAAVSEADRRTEAELAVVGDFDVEPTVAQVREILKDWKSDVPIKRIERSAPTKLTGLKEDIVTPDKANAVFVAGLAFPMKETDADYPALRLGNFLFGGGSLSSRLGNRIRQKEGCLYGVSSAVNASPRDPRPRSRSTRSPTPRTSTASRRPLSRN